MHRPRQIDYDAVAAGYDSQPYRARSIDREFVAFLAGRSPGADVAVLDLGCGTGNQLVANRAAAPIATMVGADRSLGMLRQARGKTREIAWVQADAAALPFAAGSFDFVGSQFMFHHVPDKESMLAEMLRVLRPGGQFVMRNLCPQESPDWSYYAYFPEAQVVDLSDFWPADAIAARMRAIGFAAVEIEYEHLRFDINLAEWAVIARRRDTCSQLQAISDAAYEAGLHRLRRDAADPALPKTRPDHLCMLTVRGDRGGAA